MKLKVFLQLCMLALLASCASEPKHKKDKQKPAVPQTPRERRNEKMGGTIFDEPLFTTAPKKAESSIGINSYLWKSTLDALAFMPKQSTDPFGGTVITEWWSPIETPKERLKIEVVILGRELRSDALRVSIFRQKKDAKNQWVEQAVDPKTIARFEETILAGARKIRLTEER